MRPLSEPLQADALEALRRAAAHASEQARRRCFDLYGFRWRLLVDEHVHASWMRGELAEDVYQRAISIFETHQDGRALVAAIHPPTKGTR